ncbi:MAG: hypothetical protein Q8N09_10830 [Thermodesulfovibrionia bacterium]|nr:hypothetical protein [Thermodesulfovibrionia bacterium]
MKKQLLFVTYQNEGPDEGLSYAIDLAKTLDEGITILLVKLRKFRQRLEDIMAAVAFAEAGEHETARKIASGDEKDGSQETISILLEKCKNSGVDVSVHTVLDEPVSAISNFLKKKSTIDMVILSPSVMRNGNLSARELKRLVRIASRPVVTMTKQELQYTKNSMGDD